MLMTDENSWAKWMLFEGEPNFYNVVLPVPDLLMLVLSLIFFIWTFLPRFSNSQAITSTEILHSSWIPAALRVHHASSTCIHTSCVEWTKNSISKSLTGITSDGLDKISLQFLPQNDSYWCSAGFFFISQSTLWVVCNMFLLVIVSKDSGYSLSTTTVFAAIRLKFH